MESFGKTTGDAITGVGVLIAELQKIPGSKRVTDVLFGTNIFGLLGKLAEEDAKSKAGTKANLEPRAASRVYLQQLRLENITNNVFVVGNTVVEPFKMFCDEIMRIPKRNDMILLDVHRPENFKYPQRLRNIFRFANMCIEKYNIPVYLLYFKRLKDEIENNSLVFGNI